MRILRRLLIVLVIATTLAGSAFGLWRWRKLALIQEARQVGLAAYEHRDWVTARKMLGRYVGVVPDDLDAIRKYAAAQLNIRPLTDGDLQQAIGAFRLILRQSDHDSEALAWLCALYETTGQAGELGYVARRWRESAAAHDIRPELWQIKSELGHEQRAAALTQLAALVERPQFAKAPADDQTEASLTLAGSLLSEMATASPEARQQAVLAPLNSVLERFPNATRARVARAAARRVLNEQNSAGSAELLDQARTDLEQAEADGSTDPRALLALSEEWLALGDPERAARQMEHVERVDIDRFRLLYPDPGDWLAARLTQRARILLTRRDGAAAGRLAGEILEQQQGTRQYETLLPLVFELYLADNESSASLTAARNCLENITKRRQARGAALVGNEQLILMQAELASRERDWAAVIRLLAPIAERPGFPPAVLSLLAGAYQANGQPVRAARVVSAARVDALRAFPVACDLVRADLARGACHEAERLLSRFEGTAVTQSLDYRVLKLAVRCAPAVERNARPELATLNAALAAICQEYPTRVDARILLAGVLQQLDQAAEAERILRAGLEAGPDAALLRALAHLLLEQNRQAEIGPLWQKACEQKPTEAQFWIMSSYASAAVHDPAASHAALTTGMASVPVEDQPKLQLLLAMLDLAEGKRAEGLAQLAALAKAQPRHIPVRVALLAQPETLADAAQVERLVDEIRQIEGPEGTTWRLAQARAWLGGTHWFEKRPAALELLRNCIGENSNALDAYAVMGEFCERAGDFAGAEGAYQAAIGSGGGLAFADRLLAIYQRQGRIAEARRLLTNLQERWSPENLRSRRLGLALSAGDMDAARHELEVRTSGSAAEPADLLRLASLTFAQRQALEPALEILQKAAAAGADPLAVAQVQVNLLMQARRPDEAVAAANDLVKLHRSPGAYRLRGVLQALLGHSADADADFASYAQLDSSDLGVAVRGEFRTQQNDLTGAITIWTAGLEAHPESARLKRGLAKAYLMRNGPGDSERLAQLLDALQEAGADTETTWIRIVRWQRSDDPERGRKIEQLLRAVLTMPPGEAADYVRFEAAALQYGGVRLARELNDFALRLFPRNSDLIAQRAELELGSRPDAAAELASRALDIDNRHAGAYGVLIRAKAQTRDMTALQRIAAELSALHELNPEAESWAILASQALAAQGRSGEAIQTLIQFCQGRAPTLRALLALENLQAGQDDWAAARATLEQAERLVPGTVEVQVAQISLLAREQRFDEMLTSAATGKPAAMIAAAQALSAANMRLGDAANLIRGAVRAGAASAANYGLLGDVLSRSGDLPGAEEALRNALKQEPDHPDALNNLAWLLAQRDDQAPEAVELARRAVAQRPDDLNLQDTLGLALFHARQFSEARVAYRRCADGATPKSAARARALLKLAEVSLAENSKASISALLSEVQQIADSGNELTAGERRTLEQLASKRP